MYDADMIMQPQSDIVQVEISDLMLHICMLYCIWLLFICVLVVFVRLCDFGRKVNRFSQHSLEGS